MARSLRILVGCALLATACGQPSASQTTDLRETPGSTAPKVIATEAVGAGDACPLTIPPKPAFVPPEPYPAEAPALYRAAWYGTSELWTMVAPEGEVWAGLPTDHGLFGQKTFWWSAGYSRTAVPTPAITVTGRQLDGSASSSRE